MIPILLDHNIRGYYDLFHGALNSKYASGTRLLKFIQLEDVGLPPNSSDREIWRVVQDQRVLLLTNNRNSKGVDSLQRTIETENTLDSLPILTIVTSNSNLVKKTRKIL